MSVAAHESTFNGLPSQAPEEAPLVVAADDDPDILMLVRMRLQRAGCRVLTAADGTEALALCLQHHPAIAVLDVSMPGLTGMEVTSALRAAEVPVHVILLTAHARPSDVDAGALAGADSYITKPFSPQELESCVAAALAHG
jgi:DNA-binding response OmpR family regulator